MVKKWNSFYQRGFTMIELVMVILIVGILAAAALPRFANLTSQAQTAANRGVAGGLTAGVAIAHAAWIAAGAPATSSTVTLDGNSVAVNAKGWPDGGAQSGVAAPTTTVASCTASVQAVLSNPPSLQTTAAGCNTLTNCYVVTASGNVCTLTYTPSGVASTNSITYDAYTTPGAIVVTP